MNELKFVVNSSDFHGMLTAITLKLKLKHCSPTITVIQNPSASTESKALTTLSDFKGFHDFLDLKEPVFIKETKSNFTLASQYIIEDNETYFSDSKYGLIRNGAHFHQLAQKVLLANKSLYLDQFNLASTLAKHNKFAMPAADNRSIFHSLNYGYRIDTLAYESFLSAICRQLDITIIRETITEVHLDDDNIRAIALTSKQEVSGDFFIDCSCNRELRSSGSDELLNHDQVIPGWVEQNSKGSRSNNNSPSLSKSQLLFDKARQSVTRVSTVKNDEYHRKINFDTTALQTADTLKTATSLPNAWRKNCIAIGQAYACLPGIFLEPYHLLQGQLQQLITVWSKSSPTIATKTLFNRLSQESLRHLIDLENIHIHTLKPDTKLTQANQMRLELFQSAGHIYATNNGIIPDSLWPILLQCLGYTQSRTDKITETIPIGEIDNQFNHFKKLIQKACDSAPLYDEWLDKTGITK